MQLHSSSLNFYAMFYEVRRRLSEIEAGFYTDLEIYSYLNQAQLYIARKSKCLKKEVIVTTVVSTAEYDLKDNGFDDIIDIAEDGVNFYQGGSTYMPMDFKKKWMLNRDNPGWQGESDSIPQDYYYNKSTKTIGLHPKPNSSNVGAYLFINGYYKPKILNAGTAVSGTATTIVLLGGSSTVPYPSPADDYYNNLYIEIYEGTGAGQKVKVTDYVGSSRTCTATFTTAPDNSSVYGFIAEVPEEAQYLMILFALWKLWSKGGTRTVIANNFRDEFFAGLQSFIGEIMEDDDEELEREAYN